jgi:hypothetical protein
MTLPALAPQRGRFVDGGRPSEASCPWRPVRDHDPAILECCEPTAEEAVKHVRCDALGEQQRLRNSALTAGKQLKRLAPLRAKTTSSLKVLSDRGICRTAV